MYSIDPVNGDLEMDRGDFVDPKLTITDAAGNALNVTGATFRLTVKSSLDDALASALFQIATPSGFDVTAAASGIVVPLILESYTQGLAGDYVYDVEMVLSGQTTTLVRAALFRVLKDVGDVGVAPAAPVVGYEVLNALYFKDTATGQYYKKTVLNGEEILSGPSPSYPF